MLGYLDSCASAHFTHREDWLDDVSSTSDSKIVLADNTKIESKSIGSTLIPIQIDNKPDFIKVHNVVYAPEISTNLLSVSKIIEKGHTVEFKGSRCEIKSKYGDLLATAHDHGGIYKLDSAEQSANITTTSHAPELWHRRVGHPRKLHCGPLQGSCYRLQLRSRHRGHLRSVPSRKTPSKPLPQGW
jgi:hypothetical protein